MSLTETQPSSAAANAVSPHATGLVRGNNLARALSNTMNPIRHTPRAGRSDLGLVGLELVPELEEIALSLALSSTSRDLSFTSWASVWPLLPSCRRRAVAGGDWWAVRPLDLDRHMRRSGPGQTSGQPF